MVAVSAVHVKKNNNHGNTAVSTTVVDLSMIRENEDSQCHCPNRNELHFKPPWTQPG
jgi:hypothetical protein